MYKADGNTNDLKKKKKKGGRETAIQELHDDLLTNISP